MQLLQRYEKDKIERKMFDLIGITVQRRNGSTDQT
jgi:hypothetical protein